MIIWIFGNTGAGKTTLANLLKTFHKNVVHLDGDEMRQDINFDLGLSHDDRKRNNVKIARLACRINSQGHDVIVSTICPYEDLRQEIKAMTGCYMIYVTGGKVGADYPFEIPKNPDLIVKGNEHTSN